MLTRMRQTVIALVTLVMLAGVLLPHATFATPAPMTNNYHAINGTQICANTPIPPGWVIVKILRGISSCGGLNMFEIKPYTGQSMYICANSPIPPGVIITKILQGISSCNRLNMFYIQPI